MKLEQSRTRRELLALLASLGVTGEALAQDPVRSDPRSFRVVLENDRVLRTIRPGVLVVFVHLIGNQCEHNHFSHATGNFLTLLQGFDEDPWPFE